MTKKELTDLDYAMKHKYRVTPGGEFVPGVTTIINIIDKPAFKWAAAKIAAETAVANSRRKSVIAKKHRTRLAASKGNSPTSVANRTLAAMGTADEIFVHYCRGEFDRQWKAKGARGNRVHDVAERWTRGEAVEVADDEIRYVDALEKFHREFKPVFHLTECVVLNPELRYGGRFDAIATLKDRDTAGTFMIDYKTGSEWPESVALQFAGYMNCQLPWYVDGALARFEDLPPLDGARTVYLKDDGSCEVVDPFEKISPDLAREAFNAALALYHTTNQIQRTLGKGDDDND